MLSRKTIDALGAEKGVESLASVAAEHLRRHVALEGSMLDLAADGIERAKKSEDLRDRYLAVQTAKLAIDASRRVSGIADGTPSVTGEQDDDAGKLVIEQRRLVEISVLPPRESEPTTA